MSNAKHNHEPKKQEKRTPYEPPRIIYQGKISTRAGSPLGTGPDSSPNGVDPADLFGNGG